MTVPPPSCWVITTAAPPFFVIRASDTWYALWEYTDEEAADRPIAILTQRGSSPDLATAEDLRRKWYLTPSTCVVGWCTSSSKSGRLFSHRLALSACTEGCMSSSTNISAVDAPTSTHAQSETSATKARHASGDLSGDSAGTFDFPTTPIQFEIDADMPPPFSLDGSKRNASFGAHEMKAPKRMPPREAPAPTLRIMIVEDDSFAQLVLQMLLEQIAKPPIKTDGSVQARSGGRSGRLARGGATSLVENSVQWRRIVELAFTLRTPRLTLPPAPSHAQPSPLPMEVTCVSSAEEAVGHLFSARVDIALVDIQLPGAPLAYTCMHPPSSNVCQGVPQGTSTGSF